MDDRPPRRSQRPQNKRSKAPSFPLLPFLIGVVVLGFVIGAGLSMIGRGGSRGQRVVSMATAPPPIATQAPTLAPLATPRPLPSQSDPAAAATDDATDEPASPTPAATHRATTKPKPSATLAAVAISPSPLASATPAEASAATPLVSPVTPAPLHSHTPPTPAPSRSAARTAAPETVRVAPPAPHPLVTAKVAIATAAPTVLVATIDADTDFGRLSASVVRQYLRALARGDTESAYGAFGDAPGASGVSFPERPIMESSGQIGAIVARGSSDAQTVNVTIESGGVPYVATYTVRRTPTGAAVIASHSIGKS